MLSQNLRNSTYGLAVCTGGSTAVTSQACDQQLVGGRHFGDKKEPGTGLGLLASVVSGLPRRFGKRFNLSAKPISAMAPRFELLGGQREMDGHW